MWKGLDLTALLIGTFYVILPLHWLPVRQRVNFKIAVLVFQCLTGHAPAYLADDCQLAADASARRLRSADTAKCVVRRTYNNFDDRCLAAAGPRLWYTLPLNLRLCDSLGQFKRSLKTFLFVVRPQRLVTQALKRTA